MLKLFLGQPVMVRFCMIYRLVAILFSSISFYVLNISIESIFIATGMILSNIVFLFLYLSFHGEKRNIIILELIEIISNIIIIIASGGVYSPFLFNMTGSLLLIAVEFNLIWSISVFTLYVLTTIIVTDINKLHLYRISSSIVLFSCTYVFLFIIIVYLFSYALQIQRQKNALKTLNQDLMAAQYLANKSIQIGQDFILSEERNRIANEIHDTILQKLFAISCNIAIIRNSYHTLSYESYSIKMNELEQAVLHTMKELRNSVCDELWDEEQKSLKQVLTQYLTQLSGLYDKKIHIDIMENNEMNTSIKAFLFRLVCESVNNSIRHGNADNICVTIKETGNNIACSITDNGSGFSAKETIDSTNGHGLINMLHMTKLLQGEMKIISQIGYGTTIDVLIPK